MRKDRFIDVKKKKYKRRLSRIGAICFNPSNTIVKFSLHVVTISTFRFCFQQKPSLHNYTNRNYIKYIDAISQNLKSLNTVVTGYR